MQGGGEDVDAVRGAGTLPAAVGALAAGAEAWLRNVPLWITVRTSAISHGPFGATKKTTSAREQSDGRRNQRRAQHRDCGAGAACGKQRHDEEEGRGPNEVGPAALATAGHSSTRRMAAEHAGQSRRMSNPTRAEPMDVELQSRRPHACLH